MSEIGRREFLGAIGAAAGATGIVRADSGNEPVQSDEPNFKYTHNVFRDGEVFDSHSLSEIHRKDDVHTIIEELDGKVVYVISYVVTSAKVTNQYGGWSWDIKTISSYGPPSEHIEMSNPSFSTV